MERYLDSEELRVWMPLSNGFGTVPGGTEINYARIIFDDEAEVTIGCLLLSCDAPDSPTHDESTRVDVPSFRWIAYGLEGKVARGQGS
jgi:hypothetical protein